MKPLSLVTRALALLKKTHKLREVVLVHLAVAVDAKTGEQIHEFIAVTPDDPNGRSFRTVMAADGSPRDHLPSPEPPIFSASARPLSTRARAAITIQPDSNVLTLEPGDTLDETLTVTVPKNAASPVADVYFLADTTGSMAGILTAVQAGAAQILSALGGLGLDLAFGVGNYRDFPPASPSPSPSPSPFTHQQSPTSVIAPVTAAVGAWAAAGGGDRPEAQLLALDQLAQPGGAVGWRSGAKRIVVWFGDAPGHDPICTTISGLGAAITEASVTAELVAEQITVLAISTASPGLDDDPKPISSDHTASCGPPGGAAGQASRLAAATGGVVVSGIDAARIVNTIISLVTAAVANINNLRLVPSAPIAPFVAAITPATGYGPLAGDRAHVLNFDVTLRGMPCQRIDQMFNGTLDVLADSVVVATKQIRITVPSCKPKQMRYSVKFICGVQADTKPRCGCASVQPGRHATQISIHNDSNDTVEIRKQFIPLVLAGAPLGRNPQVAEARAEDSIKLPPHTGTMDDCCRITELLFGAPLDGLTSVTLGVMEITASRDVSVTAIYTTGCSLKVNAIKGRAV